jgi:hypothetical protein
MPIQFIAFDDSLSEPVALMMKLFDRSLLAAK